MVDKMNGYAIENARSTSQAQVMEDAAKAKKCIFCDIDFTINKPLNKKGEFDPEGKDWPLLWVWENPFPQEYHKHQLLIIPRRHINNEEWYLITDKEWSQILDAWKWAQTFYDLPGGGFVGRFGERSHNAGTIGHLHFQLQVPNGTGNVKATFFKDRSPAEEARRANRKIYSDKNLKIIDGYAIRNKHGEFLGKNMRWQKNSFIHAPGAVDHIGSALIGWGETENIFIQRAILKCYENFISPTDTEQHLFKFLAEKANSIAYQKGDVEGFIFQNKDGLFLSRLFSWEERTTPEKAFVHSKEAYEYIMTAINLVEVLAATYSATIAADAHGATIQKHIPPQ